MSASKEATKKLLGKCNFSRRAKSLAEREVGCPLDHCMCGTHDAENKAHECKIPEDDPFDGYGKYYE